MNSLLTMDIVCRSLEGYVQFSLDIEDNQLSVKERFFCRYTKLWIFVEIYAT